MNPKIRVTGILIEDERILIVKQRVNDKRKWSLPGGHIGIGGDNRRVYYQGNERRDWIEC